MKAIFKEKASKVQINWGGNDDPNELLEVGKTYDVLKRDVHSWHTKIILADFPDKKFNDVNFQYA